MELFNKAELKSLKYVDLNKLITNTYLKLTQRGVKVSKEQVTEIFKFQFYMMRQKQKDNEYIKLPVIGAFFIKSWKFVLENERILFGVKNPKLNHEYDENGKHIPQVKLKTEHIDYNYLIYNEMRALHTTFKDIDLYQKEVLDLYEKFKDKIISIEMLKEAQNNKDIYNLIRRMLYSKKEESTSWYTNRYERKNKIEHHKIDGYKDKLDLFKEKYKSL